MSKKFLFLSFASLFLSSCSLLSSIGDYICTIMPDSDHCYQFTAIQSGSPDACDAIKGTKFKDTGSNPPRDKCYLQVAVNKEVYTICNRIQGGLMSYTPWECIGDVGKKILDEAVTTDDIGGCVQLKKLPAAYQSSYTDCVGKIATPEKLKSGDDKIDDVISLLKKDPDNADLKKQLDKLKTDKQSKFELMTDAGRAAYVSDKREQIMKDIDDSDVASVISKEYTTYRNSEKNINKLMDKLQEITDRQKLIKSIDEDANTLTDQIKGQLEGYVGDKKDAAIEAMGDKAKEWIKENGWDKLKWSLKNMEWAMGKYEKGTEAYDAMKGKYDKLKGAYDEVMGIYDRVDQVNKMVAEGKIDAGKAKVLKGAILLDKGLEYTTEYVPVFGSTISKVSKATFGTVIEIAKKRAIRTTSIDKCFDDPANCDTDGISAY